MSKLRVLMLSDYFFPQIGGGTEKVIFEISKRLVNMGCEILVITLGNNQKREFYEINKIKVCRLSGFDLTGAIGLQTAFPKDILGACRIARNFRPHLIHAHNRFFITTLLAVLIKRLCNTKLIVTAHLGDVRNLALIERFKTWAITAYEQTLCRVIFRSSDKVITVSKSVQKHLRSLGVSPKKMIVIQNGVDLEEFAPEISEHNDESFATILFIGRLLPNKGVKIFMEAANIICTKSPKRATFKIVGDNRYSAQLNEFFEKSEVSKNFQFIGKVPKVSTILQEGGIFVRPSYTEGMPLTVLEAMSAGLPIVATNVGGTSELIKNNDTGLLVEAGDSRQLAEAILSLLEDPKHAKKLGQNAHAFIKQGYSKKYSWDAVAAKNLSVYNELTGEYVC
jgi:glycosyltransferase involved in cell wall biosynthesis